MECARCNGFMVYESWYGRVRFSGWRCLNCGNIVFDNTFGVDSFNVFFRHRQFKKLPSDIYHRTFKMVQI